MGIKNIYFMSVIYILYFFVTNENFHTSVPSKLELIKITMIQFSKMNFQISSRVKLLHLISILSIAHSIIGYNTLILNT